MDPSTHVRKPMFARKSSCGRKQMKMLKRMRHACKLEMAAKGCSNGESYEHLAEVLTSGLNCSPPKRQNILLSPPPTLNKPGSELVVGSNIGTCNGGSREPTKELPKRPSDTNSDMKEFLSAGALQDILWQLYEEEGCFAASKPVEVHLDLVLTSCLADSKEQRSPLATVTSQDKERYRKPQLGHSSHLLEQESEVISHSYQEATDSSVLPVETTRKRRLLESNNGVPDKRLKASDRAGDSGSTNQEHWQNALGKLALRPPRAGKVEQPKKCGKQRADGCMIKSLIQDHLDSAVGDLDHKLQHLKERVDSTQCLMKLEGITTKIVKRISKLDKRVNGVIAVQKAELCKKAKLPGSDSSNMILNCPRSLPIHTDSQLAPSTVTTSAGGKDLPVAAESITSSIASPQAAESSEDIVCLDAENYHSPGVPTAKTPDVRQNRASVTAGASAQTPDNRKNEIVIDLTEMVIDLTEEESSTKPDALGKEERTVSGTVKPAPKAPKAGPLQQALPSPNKVPGEGLQLPPLPEIRPLPELVTDFKGTLPPQKLKLTVVKLLNPKGLALQLDVSHVDTRCASLESIHLFFFVDNANTKTPFSWTQVKVIKAVPLPMFVSLAELPASGTYYFTLQSKDIYGRYGPFCDIQVISVV